mmetsp:Transcript_21039/g.31312  ORF Transcript_21039/g.31312 Transcript_21039/m.31312 type:complete len:92 (-) Transcript_21039:25-300(-)
MIEKNSYLKKNAKALGAILIGSVIVVGVYLYDYYFPEEEKPKETTKTEMKRTLSMSIGSSALDYGDPGDDPETIMNEDLENIQDGEGDMMM